MTCERPAILSHASNAELVASYTQPQPGQPEKVLVSSSGTSHQWIIGGNQGDHIRPLRPSAHNTELYVDSNNSLWVQVGDHPGGETEWFLSDPITNPSDQFHYNIVNSARQRWVLMEGSSGTQVTVAPIGHSPFTLATHAVGVTANPTIPPHIQHLWSCNNGC